MFMAAHSYFAFIFPNKLGNLALSFRSQFVVPAAPPLPTFLIMNSVSFVDTCVNKLQKKVLCFPQQGGPYHEPLDHSRLLQGLVSAAVPS